MESIAQKLIIGVQLLALSGCTFQSLRPTELTFAGKDVMLRAIEPFQAKVEYYDTGAKAIKIKKAMITPPVWIVSDEMVNEPFKQVDELVNVVYQ